ncbi:MAG: hypothetical protein AAF282_02190 [Cyanobacteria bacterium P01_A01_bin.15]
MTLPDGFSHVEHLQDTLRRTFKREVREWFREVDLDDLDINTPRTSLATACEHQDEDSLIMTVARVLLFETVRGRAVNVLAGGLSNGVGETRRRHSVLRRDHPQIVLYFLEDLSDVEPGYEPVQGRISFRLMDHTASTMTPAIAQTYAQRIKSNFATGGGFIWKKGREMGSYADWPKGYQFQLLVKTEAEARRIIEASLNVQNDTPNWEFFNYSTNAEPATAFPTIPETNRVYGETKRGPRRRPVADVRFQYAHMIVPGRSSPVALVDRTGLLSGALVI